MKYADTIAISPLNLLVSNVNIARKVHSYFQLKGLVFDEYHSKNIGLCRYWRCSNITVLVGEMNKILAGLKQRGSSIMFFKSLISIIQRCWGIAMNSPLHFMLIESRYVLDTQGWHFDVNRYGEDISSF